jgi:hypothetical protein
MTRPTPAANNVSVQTRPHVSYAAAAARASGSPAVNPPSYTGYGNNVTLVDFDEGTAPGPREHHPESSAAHVMYAD